MPEPRVLNLRDPDDRAALDRLFATSPAFETLRRTIRTIQVELAEQRQQEGTAS